MTLHQESTLNIECIFSFLMEFTSCGSAVEQMFVSLQNSHIETTPHNMMVLWAGALGKYLGSDEVVRVEPSWMGLVSL